MRSLAVALCLLTFDRAAVSAQPTSAEEIENFMRSAKVVRVRELSTGITRPLRLTLTDGTTTHDAVFQAIDEKKSVFQPQTGPSQINFVRREDFTRLLARSAPSCHNAVHQLSHECEVNLDHIRALSRPRV